MNPSQSLIFGKRPFGVAVNAYLTNYYHLCTGKCLPVKG